MKNMITSTERQVPESRSTAAARLVGCSFAAIIFAGCAVSGGLHVETPAANPEIPAPGSARPRAVLGMDDATRKTDQLLAAAGATKLEGLKPMQHDMGGMKMDGMKGGGMEGMDHSKMPGMKSGDGMEGMEHSKMPAMQGAPKGQQKPGGMEGMDHSKMPGMGAAPAGQQKPGGMEGMDHSKMPGMKGGSAAAPDAPPSTDKKAVTEEMKKLSDEMKKTSDEMKKKSDAAAKPANPPPQP